jgi:peptidoglycan-associated lipoprotein
MKTKWQIATLPGARSRWKFPCPREMGPRQKRQACNASGRRKHAPAPVHTAPVHTVAATTTPTPNAATRARIDELLAKIEDVRFDYNKATFRSAALKALQADSTELRNILKDYPDYKLTIEGHCDDRDSDEHNPGLGDRRARAAKDYLVQAGIPSAQLNVKSHGNERPAGKDHDETCWQRTRRLHIIAMAEAH